MALDLYFVSLSLKITFPYKGSTRRGFQLSCCFSIFYAAESKMKGRCTDSRKFLILKVVALNPRH